MIRFGGSPFVGEDVILEHTPTNPYPVSGITFSSASDIAAEWYITSSQSMIIDLDCTSGLHD